MNYAISDHYDGRFFYNQNPEARKLKGFGDILKWKVGSVPKKWPNFREGRSRAQLAGPDLRAGDLVVTFINHATALVQVKGANILTDPVFSQRVSPVSWAGPARHREPGLHIDELPQIDVILISHNHYDHLDLAALKRLNDLFAPLLICPLGNRSFFESKNFKKIVELDWWQSESSVDDLKFYLTPAQHWSSRSPFDRNKSLWGGYVIQSYQTQVFFSGDTGYYSHFKQVFERFGAMDFSLLPIGAYEPRWFMSDQHMNPHEAVRAHLDLHSRFSMGIHFGTFQLTDEGIDEPVQDLKTSLREWGVPDQEFVAPDNGESFFYQK